MNMRERFNAVCGFEKTDRPIRRESMGFWKETYGRWHAEGLPPAVSDDVFTAPVHFGFDTMCWVGAVLDVVEEPGFWPRFEERVIESNDAHIIKIDKGGNTIRIMADGRSTIPQVLSNPVKTMKDFEELKWRLDPENPDRLPGYIDLVTSMANAVEDKYTCCVTCGLFGTFRHLLGLKGLSISMRRDPALMHAIAEQWVRFNSSLIKKIDGMSPVDFIYFWEDMAYKNGPMISPQSFKEFMSPYYTELINTLKRDTPIRTYCVDTDGNVWLLIPLFLQCGINMMLPFEVQAGMDIREVRKEFGKELIIWGGLDKMTLAGGEEDIRREVTEKVPFMLETGGYITALDHLVPPEVPLKNFEYYLELVRGI